MATTAAVVVRMYACQCVSSHHVSLTAPLLSVQIDFRGKLYLAPLTTVSTSTLLGGRRGVSSWGGRRGVPSWEEGGGFPPGEKEGDILLQ